MSPRPRVNVPDEIVEKAANGLITRREAAQRAGVSHATINSRVKEWRDENGSQPTTTNQEWRSLPDIYTSIACPFCEAGIGETCTTENGYLHSRPHTKRLQRLAEQHGFSTSKRFDDPDDDGYRLLPPVYAKPHCDSCGAGPNAPCRASGKVVDFHVPRLAAAARRYFDGDDEAQDFDIDEPRETPEDHKHRWQAKGHRNVPDPSGEEHLLVRWTCSVADCDETTETITPTR